MRDDPSADGVFALIEQVLMVVGVVLIVVALVAVSPLGFLSGLVDDSGGDEAAAAETPTQSPTDATSGAEPTTSGTETDGQRFEAPDEEWPPGTADGTPTPTETSEDPPRSAPESTPEPTPTPTEEPTPTETDDGPGIGPGDPPGRGPGD